MHNYLWFYLWGEMRRDILIQVEKLRTSRADGVRKLQVKLKVSSGVAA